MQTIRPWLLIGRHRETQDTALLARAAIGALLHLAEHVSLPSLAVLSLPIEDGVPVAPCVLREGVDFVLAQRDAGHRVLIACGAGISRSTTFAIAALKEAEELSLHDAMRVVRRAHPDGMPHPALWASLCEICGEPVDYLVLVRGSEV